MTYELTNPNASAKTKELFTYLTRVYGKKVFASQHTKTTEQQEIWDLQDVSGKLPAICGFELLGYSPNINFTDTDDEAITEAVNNMNTIDTAIEWATKKRGIVTYCWHWFSPLRGHSKSFFTENTDFDLAKAMKGNCPEYTALLRDIDYMANLLKRFSDRDIPILWRPLHESDGKWFWWGAKGAEPCRALWKLMYDRFTNFHHLNNLIWIWNNPVADAYPGDDCVDIISRDLYVQDDSPQAKEYVELSKVTRNKMRALAECGIQPNADKMKSSNTMWLWAMAWSFDDCFTNIETPAWDTTGKRVEEMKVRMSAFYNNKNVITLDQLPWNRNNK